MKTARSNARNARLVRLYQSLQKINDQRYFYSIRTAFVSTMPIMLAGAYATVINNLPIPPYQDFMAHVFGEDWRLFGQLVFNATMQIITLLVVFSICLNLARWYNTNRHRQVPGAICGMVGLAAYILVSVPVDSPDSFSFEITGVIGLFVGMVVAVAASELFIFFLGTGRVNRIMSDDPSLAVPQSFAAVRPAIIVIAAFALFRVVLVAFGVKDGLSEIVYAFLSQPYEGRSDSFGTALLFDISSHIMWLFGIHGNNVLDEVAQTYFVPALQQNIAAVAAGLPPPNLITKTLFDAFVYMGGSGTTLGLLGALLIFGRARGYRALFKYALPNSIFNINEPLVFGIPIVLNPIYAIPFVLTPVVMLTTTSLAMVSGLVPYTIAEVAWTTPIFFSGYAATGSVAGIVLQAVNLALAILIYAPFVRLSEKMVQLRFEHAYKDLCNLINKDYYAAAGKLIARVDEVGAVSRRLGTQLAQAIPSGEMFLHYQPIVDSRTNALHSVEALLRWRHPQHGMINPMVTVALAEETGRIDKLGLWILEQALMQRAQWSEVGLPDFHVSVNVSAHQLDSPVFHEQVAALLARYMVPPRQLQIEVTETAALVENDATRGNLAKLHDMGVTIAMDDFGVGHSSLLYLRTQPITTLKIDGSLSRDILRHPANLDIIATIHDLCNLLGITTIIEFVDNQEQLDRLKGIGAFLIQGYYYSPALPGDEIPLFIRKMEREKGLGD